MEKILDLISREVEQAFEANGYDSKFGRVSLSNRPDLCEYSCATISGISPTSCRHACTTAP